ncbi:BadF/BadG/BcrA/BcrD ATPase family protein [Streptomyces sp. NPDC055140]
MSRSGLYLGVDAGNSKTVALLCLPSGETVGAGRAGCGDIYGAPSPADAVREVTAAIGDALAAAGAGRASVAGAAFRLAGVDWPEDREFWEGVLEDHCPALRRRTVLNDGYASIRCGELSGAGVSVQSGTAAAVAARGRTGAMWDMGFRVQHPMGASGLVIEALRAVFLADLGLAPQTDLTKALVEFYDQPGVEELNHWFTRRVNGAPLSARPRAARVVTAVAAAGDPVAEAIVREEGRRLAMYAGVAARATGLAEGNGTVDVVLSGSVLMAADSPVTAALVTALEAELPGAVPHRAVLPPVAGAALDALGENGVAVTETVAARLAASLPPPGFFTT